MVMLGSSPDGGSLDDGDAAAVGAQLGREPRGVLGVAHRCPCGLPDVVETAPRLPDGTPFPTLYYLTCPRATAAVGTLESEGLMRIMSERLATDTALADAYRRAHEGYVTARERHGVVPEIADPVGRRHAAAGQVPARARRARPRRGPRGQPVRGRGAGRAFTLVGRWAVRATGRGAGRGGRSVTGAVRVAAVDCGTNSIRLLVADLDPRSGDSTELDRTMQIVRLGEGVDRTGRLSDAALERTFAACEAYAARIAELGAERVRFVATSASRDAENAAEFVAGVRARLGVTAEVVTGDEEAALSFAGATRDLQGREPGPFLVVDIGGGSTEFVLGDERPVAARSVDVGCVRITERRLHSDPPTLDEVEAARADIAAAVEAAGTVVQLTRARTLVGLAGSVTTLAAMDAGLSAYDPDATHHYRLPAASVRDLTTRLLAMTRAERARIPVMHPGRVDVIAAGALVLDAVVTAAGLPEVLVSEHDILDGIAWSLVT